MHHRYIRIDDFKYFLYSYINTIIDVKIKN